VKSDLEQKAKEFVVAHRRPRYTDDAIKIMADFARQERRKAKEEACLIVANKYRYVTVEEIIKAIEAIED